MLSSFVCAGGRPSNNNSNNHKNNWGRFAVVRRRALVFFMSLNGDVSLHPPLDTRRRYRGSEGLLFFPLCESILLCSTWPLLDLETHPLSSAGFRHGCALSAGASLSAAQPQIPVSSFPMRNCRIFFVPMVDTPDFRISGLITGHDPTRG